MKTRIALAVSVLVIAALAWVIHSQRQQLNRCKQEAAFQSELRKFAEFNACVLRFREAGDQRPGDVVPAICAKDSNAMPGAR